MRRIEAVTGAGALDYLRRLEDELGETGRAAARRAASRSPRASTSCIAEQREREKEIESSAPQAAPRGGGRDLLAEARDVGGMVLAARVEVDDAKVLRDTGDQLRDKLGSGVVVLAGVGGARSSSSRW